MRACSALLARGTCCPLVAMLKLNLMHGNKNWAIIISWILSYNYMRNAERLNAPQILKHDPANT